MSISHEQAEPRVKLTYDDLILFPDDGNRHEIINGRHVLNASPVPRHQRISFALQTELHRHLGPAGHEVLGAPIDVQLSDVDVVVPDLVVVLSENDIITDTRIVGAPDLIVEILSPSTRAKDENLKRRLYEQAGVPNYWIADPDANSVTALRMSGGLYEQASPVSDPIELQVGKDAITVDLTKIW